MPLTQAQVLYSLWLGANLQAKMSRSAAPLESALAHVQKLYYRAWRVARRFYLPLVTSRLVYSGAVMSAEKLFTPLKVGARYCPKPRVYGPTYPSAQHRAGRYPNAIDG